MSKVLLKNIGTIVSGDISNPLLEGDAIFVQEGKIQKVGKVAALNVSDADVVIDCAGTTVTPGLFDSHCHVVLGDYTPRQKQTGFLESEVHGGVTSCNTDDLVTDRDFKNGDIVWNHPRLYWGYPKRD